MTQTERYGSRSLAYSAWHRTKSIQRFVESNAVARQLAQIDLDHTLWIEYQDKTREVLALIEEAQDVEQSYKCGDVTKNLASRVNCDGIPALIVLWTPAETRNPADASQFDIKSFRVKRIWPEPETDWEVLTPKEYAQKLLAMRQWQIKKMEVARNEKRHSLPT